MRRALIGIIMAATVLTPLAAQAQVPDRSGDPDMQERSARIEQRARERQERREARQQPAQAPAVATERRDRRDRRERSAESGSASGYQRGWQGSDDPRLREHQRRYDRIGRENAVRHGSREQARDAIADAPNRRERRELIRERQETAHDRRDERRDWRDRRDGRRDWSRDWRRDRRYDWWSWRDRNRYLYRMPPYYSPYRHRGYSRFGIGIFLGRPYYSQRYWISDPWRYRLPPAPYGTQWVRYYDDVLLIDTWTGEVLDVIYDFFW